MKKLMLLIAVLSLGLSSFSFARGVPKLTILGEEFREVIELSLSKTATVANLDETAAIVAEASFANKTCSLKVAILSSHVTSNSSFSSTSKSLEKCQLQISKFIVKNF